jgi:sigma-54 dependent transcriptional regulator, acetoin dehydrogenase operon transcriptional activator AcoR
VGKAGLRAHLLVFQQPARRPAAELSSHRHTFDDIVGFSPGIMVAKEWAQLAAANPTTVLIRGESGTGKELFAQAIHNASPRKECPFIAINSAALPETLIESELFGYEDGSFTGAKKGGQAGKFELANGGTVFLDEIGDMSLGVQAKLLRVIQEKKCVRIGSANERLVDIRVIAATHKDLYAEVQRGNFRQDLYYRLNVVEIKIPPLRDRKEEIPALTTHLVQKIAKRFNRQTAQVEGELIHKLQQHDWPGNIRELENTIERALVRAGEGGVLTAEILEFPDQKCPVDGPSPETPKLEKAPIPVRPLKEVERDMIREALAFFQGNIQQAAAKLGIGRNTFYRKMKEYGIS